MTCDEIDELAGAIALDAIPAEEWPAIREHLATCRRSHPLVRELRQVATLLLEAAPAVEPPTRLRDRIVSAARAEGAASPPAAPAVSAPPSPVPVIERRERAWWARPAWGVAAAAALVALAFGLWSVALRRDLDRTQERLAQAERQIAADEQALTALAFGGQEFRFATTLPGAAGTVVRPRDGKALLVVQGLPRQADKTYQVWALRGDQPVSLGVFEPDESGRKVVALDHDLHNVDAVAITVEPGPRGSPLPTTQPFMVAPVRG